LQNPKASSRILHPSKQTVFNGAYMAKTNFTKVEGLLEAQLEKMGAKELGKLADIAQKVERPEMRRIVETASIAAAKNEIDRTSLLHAIRHAVDNYKVASFYTAIGMTSKELKALLDIPRENLTKLQWGQLLELRPKIKQFKENYNKTHPEAGDDSLVKKERTKHLNKRFNVKDKWLPL
jgi:hypothetical protein